MEATNLSLKTIIKNINKKMKKNIIFKLVLKVNISILSDTLNELNANSNIETYKIFNKLINCFFDKNFIRNNNINKNEKKKIRFSILIR
jgi:hypothetical protein